MKTINVDLQKISSIEEFHDFMEKELEIQDAYGRNLDALYDILTSSTEDISMKFVKKVAEEETEEEKHLHRYWEILNRMLMDAEEENEHLKIEWEELSEDV